MALPHVWQRLPLCPVCPRHRHASGRGPPGFGTGCLGDSRDLWLPLEAARGAAGESPCLGPGLPLRVWLQVTEEGGPCGPRLLIHLSIHPLTDPPVHASANISISPSVHPQAGMSFYSIIHPFICQYPTQPASQLSSSLCIHPSLCLCIRSPFFIHLPIFTSTQPPNHSSIHLSIIMSIHPSIHPSIHHQLHPLIIHPPIFNLHPSICPFVFQSIYPLPVHPAVLSIILPCHHSLT